MAYGYNPDDYQLKISAVTEGGKEVTTLADQIEALGKDAGSAQNEFQQLAQALRNTGQSQEALETFRAVKLETQRLRQELDGAAGAVDRYESELSQARTATQSAAQVQADAAAKLAQSRQGYDQVSLSLRSARNEVKFFRDRIKETGDSTGIYAQQLAAAQAKVDTLSTAQKSARAEVRALAGDHRTAAGEVKAAQAAEAGLEKQYLQSIGTAKSLSAALQEENTRLDAARAVLNAAGIETTNLSAAQSKLAAEMQKTAQAAQALSSREQQAADLAQRRAALASSIAERERKNQQAIIDKQRELAQVAAMSGAVMQNAYGVVGVRSAAAIQAEITRVNQALTALATNTRVSGSEFTRAYAAGQAKIAALKAELDAASRSATGLASNVKAGSAGMVASLAHVKTALLAIAGANEFLQANVGLEALERALTQITGSAEAAQREITWLRQNSERLGLAGLSSAKAYINLAAAAKGSALEGEGARRIFEAVAGSMSKLGKSSAETEGALQAIGQMFGKGVVSMEEWRQQLAERLPGAAQATAESLGMTVGELSAMIATGTVLAEDLLPHLAAGLEKVYATNERVEGSVSAWNRFRNAVDETFQFLGQSGVMQGAAQVLEVLAEGVRGAAAGFEYMGVTIGNVAALATEVWTNPKGALDRFVEEQNRAAESIRTRLKPALDDAAQAQAKLAAQTAAASAQAQSGIPSWMTVGNAYAKVTDAAEKATAQAVKAQAARAEEGRAAIALANALGSESEKRAASLQVAQQDAQALRDVAAAREQEAKVQQALAQTLAEVAKAEGVVSEGHRKGIQEAQEKAAALQSEAEKAAAAALAAQQHAAALEVESAALADNSSRVYELQAAWQQAQEKLAQIQAARKAGNASLAEEQAATIAAAKAGALYRDALADVTAKIQQKAAAQKASNDLAQAETSLALQQLRNAIAIAEARGDEAESTRLKNQASQLEIKLAQLKAEALRAEAAAILELVRAKRKELEASGQLTPAKKAELDAQEASAKMKQVEAEMADEAARYIRDMAEATREAGQAARDSRDGLSGMADDLDRVAGAADRAGRGLKSFGDRRDRLGRDANGVRSEGISAATYAAKLGINADQLSEFESLFNDQAKVEWGKLVGKQSQEGDVSRSLLAAAEYAAAQVRKNAAAQKDTGGNTTTTRHEIKLTLPNNQTKTFSMASADDASGLANFLAQLGDAQSRS